MLSGSAPNPRDTRSNPARRRGPQHNHRLEYNRARPFPGTRLKQPAWAGRPCVCWCPYPRSARVAACAGGVYEAVSGPAPAGCGAGLEGQRRADVRVPGFPLAGGVRMAVGVRSRAPRSAGTVLFGRAAPAARIPSGGVAAYACGRPSIGRGRGRRGTPSRRP